MMAQMRKGSVVVDVAIDQGGCVEGARATSHTDPVIDMDGVTLYCVANMPGCVARTSTFALTNATLPYASNLANLGWREALKGVLGSIGAFAGHRPRAVVGRDPRASGEFLAAAVIAGLASAGVDVIDLGVLPTPGVAHLTGALAVDLGVMLSASHNPMPDNGIKFFARGGHKLPDELEDAIEDRIGEPWERPTGAAVGRVSTDLGLAADRYVAHLIETLQASEPEPLAGLRIAVDCANGAASDVGPAALRAAGADVVVINASPDGRNINENCGSTHPEQLQAAWSPQAPTWVWPSTATRIAASRWTARDAGRRRPDHGHPRVALKGRGELEATPWSPP